MKLKFNPIGSIFQEGNVILKVVEIKDPKTCKGCWYAGKTNGKRNWGSCYTNLHACTSGNRKDRKQVIFSEVKLLSSPSKVFRQKP